MSATSTSARGQQFSVPVFYDRVLLLTVFMIVALGLLMVASASMVISDKHFGHPFHFLAKQLVYFGVGLVLAMLVFRVHTKVWQRSAPMLLLVAIGLLIMVLIPGLGHKVNGSTRWLGISGFGLQVSEVAKLLVTVFMADFIVRRQEEVRDDIKGFLKPMAVLGLVAILLLKEPDFGAATVIMMTALSMLFVGGVRFSRFLILFLLVVSALALLAVASPYRLERLTTFLNPWAVQFDSGYQLTQSLIAFGRGGWAGVGLGESMQKLFYLPEAHTDFLFAVLAEELGLAGVLVVIGLFSVLVTRVMMISHKAKEQGRFFCSYLAFGIGVWIGIQAMINIGVSSGVLPTKGLTLPLMSYGGSSMLINCIVIALLLRIDHESRLTEAGIT